ncbi:MAG: GspE/PulE family protein [Saccharofermentans sp.]|jgi:type IV pilus assembly protein PilB|nr:GspE/PulE family protein [Mageeibacillus sp.]MCI1263944.1 GspE/PulE family protein [Saccharofermentans sp.]MCI1275615.1 GspE/PulE family protein [Saccharofermentans sp.]MCI1768886.1 GspE/PulE family protein [Mageeibacillus sp.]MCI2044642.1 GspE/PulE family protein [Mageeibacillus sp.]
MKRLGDILVESGFLNATELAEALSMQKETGKRLGEVIVESGLMTEFDILRAVSSQYSYPIIDLTSIDVDPKATSLLNQKFCEDNVVLPIGFDDDKLVVAIDDPVNITIEDELQFQTGYMITLMLATHSSIMDAIKVNYGRESAAAAAEELGADLASDQITENSELTEAVNSAPVVKLVNSMIDYAIRAGSSDIHIEPMDDRIRVRIRIDGVMQEIMSNPLSAKDAITTRIKILGGMNIAEKRIPQDGRISTEINGENVDMRVSILPTVTGEKTVIRILAKNDGNLNRKYLGISDRNNALIDKIIKVPQGICLISGPTGSGKTTTLYTLLAEKNTPDTNIITVEDPVEIRIPGLNQVQVNAKAGMTFASGLRSILRQDPDIVLVGEIRDGETAEIAMRAAITGHLVFSTIHTNDAVSSINRLIDMGLEPYMVSSALVGVVSQRLVRRICTNCREAYEPEPYEVESLRLEPGQKLYRGKGCSECNDKGYKGRIAIHEIVIMTKKMKSLLEKRASEDEMRKLAVTEGTQMLQESARALVLEGITTVEELNRVAYTID